MNFPKISKQSGSVLAISLVLLTAITVLAVMSMQRAGLQTRITSNILHREILFNSALNEQESWFYQLKTAATGDAMLSEPIRSYYLDGNGSQVYIPVPLATVNVIDPFLQMGNELIRWKNPPGKIALAQGEQNGDRITIRYQLTSATGIANRTEGRSMTETQTTGLSFPGLNTTKNSKTAGL